MSSTTGGVFSGLAGGLRKNKEDSDDKRKLTTAKAAASAPKMYGGTGSDEGPVEGYKRGGRVKRTGLAKLHKGEQVLKPKVAKKYRRKHGVKR